MTCNVVSIESALPHTSGPCHCAQCGHEWIGVIRSGSAAITCPECGTGKGMRSGFVFPDAATYRCPACIDSTSNDLFTILEDYRIMCAHCGDVQPWPKH